MGSFVFVGIDGNEYTFKREPNSLNMDHMWTINDWKHCFYGSKREVNKIERDIKANCQWRK
jgi:hypothetical protein